MSSLNRVMLLGRLGKDPELRYTKNREPVTTMTLATTDRWKDPSGNAKEATEWHTVVVWGKQAEACAEYLKKGSTAFVEGALKTRQWEDKDGAKRYTTEIKASNVLFTASAKPSERQDTPARAPVDPWAMDIPFAP